MEDQDPWWTSTANNLADLFTYIPNFKLSDLGDDPQKFLAAYVPTTGSWDERAERLRQYFVSMGQREFQVVYMTYKQQGLKPGA